MGTAFVSVLRPRQLSWVSLIHSSEDGQMEIVRVYALHSHSMAAAGRHLIVASAEGQSIIHFQHVLLTPRFVSMMLWSGFDLFNYLEWNV